MESEPMLVMEPVLGRAASGTEVGQLLLQRGRPGLGDQGRFLLGRRGCGRLGGAGVATGRAQAVKRMNSRAGVIHRMG